MGTVRVLFVTALVFLATTHFLGSVQARKISAVKQVSAKLQHFKRTLRQETGGEMCTDEEFSERLLALDLPPQCGETIRDLVEGNTSITEVETFEPTCDIACLRPLHALLTECYGEEAAGLYELLCSRNENGDLCSLLSVAAIRFLDLYIVRRVDRAGRRRLLQRSLLKKCHRSGRYPWVLPQHYTRPGGGRLFL